MVNFIILLLATVVPASDLNYFLGEGKRYVDGVPRPEDILGYQVGDWHVRHDQLVAYMNALAQSSDRVQLARIGASHEQRPLIHLTISSPENLSRLDEIRSQHLALASSQSKQPSLEQMPLVVWLGYSVHGNEASGSNAALVVAYYLAAAMGIEDLLEKTVIILDPSLNPDGLNRFASWVNMHRGKVLMADGSHREHTEGWPSGRTNHYWFDLNRDWLLLQHPESAARVEQFHRWRPNILTDHHEMGTDSTFFFQPGVPSRQNPLTPKENFSLTSLIGTYHARAFNREGELYFTKQVFDDFYYGKGSTYPDIQGCIGILFEQASVRGHLRENALGKLSFPKAIKNQITVSLSTLEAGYENREQLLAYQAGFFRKSRDIAKKDPVKGYVFNVTGDPTRTMLMGQILQQHGIQLFRLAKTVTHKEKRFDEGLVVPLDQDQYLLIKSLFEEMTEFPDETFYDVSTWHFPSAYGASWTPLNQGAFGKQLLGEPIGNQDLPSFPIPSGDLTSAYALVFDWSSYFAPRALQRLLNEKVNLRFATKPFEVDTSAGPKSFGAGSVVVPMGHQTTPASEIIRIFETIAAKDGVEVFTAISGLSRTGGDLGGPSFRPLKAHKTALIVGPDVSAYEAGEVWHLFDAKMALPLTLLEKERLGRVDLNTYTHIVMVDGRYGKIPSETIGKLKRWVRQGGTLIATKNAVRWAVENELLKAKVIEAPATAEDEGPPQRQAYGDRAKIQAQDRISGAVFRGDIDRSHPLGFGYSEETVSLFRNHGFCLAPSENPFATVVQYTKDSRLSGFVSSENQKRVDGSAAVIAEGVGRGAVIYLLDNPNFRGFWSATHKLLLNGIFFSDYIEPNRNSNR